MCCFSRPVKLVGASKLFARGLPDGRQALAYAMNVALDEELAMILPLPVAANPSDDAVSFINLEGEDRFFDELASAFPAFGMQPARLSFGPVTRAAKLHERLAASCAGPGQVRFTPFTERVAPQGITLGFAQLPTPDEALAINAELARLLERALATAI